MSIDDAVHPTIPGGPTVTRTLAAALLLVVARGGFGARTPPNPRAVAEPPAAAKKPVTDTYHGVTVVDDYRWLEDGSNKDVKAWSDAQNEHARASLSRW